MSRGIRYVDVARLRAAVAHEARERFFQWLKGNFAVAAPAMAADEIAPKARSAQWDLLEQADKDAEEALAEVRTALEKLVALADRVDVEPLETPGRFDSHFLGLLHIFADDVARDALHHDALNTGPVPTKRTVIAEVAGALADEVGREMPKLVMACLSLMQGSWPTGRVETKLGSRARTARPGVTVAEVIAFEKNAVGNAHDRLDKVAEAVGAATKRPRR